MWEEPDCVWEDPDHAHEESAARTASRSRAQPLGRSHECRDSVHMAFGPVHRVDEAI